MKRLYCDFEISLIFLLVIFYNQIAISTQYKDFFQSGKLKSKVKMREKNLLKANLKSSQYIPKKNDQI